MITSRSNPKIKYLRSLRQSKKRLSEGAYLIEGIRLMEEAFRNPELIQETYCSETVRRQERGVSLLEGLEKFGIPVISISESVADALSDTKNSQGIFALVKRVESTEEAILSHPSFLGVLLFNVQDPGNSGAMMRISEAFGVTGVFFARAGVDPFHPKVVRSSMGSIFRIPIARVSPLSVIHQCREKRIQVITADVEGKKSFRDMDYRKPTLLIFGQEGSGLPGEMTGWGDGSVSIAINPNVESLNVAAASSIILCEAARQRSLKKQGEGV